MTIEYITLLNQHALYYRQPPPILQRDTLGQWTCSYMGNWVTTVCSANPNGRNEAARLMWVVAGIRQPLPRP